MMKYNTLGKTDLKVSSICLGTMTWGLQNTEKEGHEQMDYALERGINFFDTAELYAVPPSKETYGKTEKIIGTYFASRKNRDRVILASKVAGPGLPYVRGGKYKIDRKNITEALEESLRRLQTDYIDLYQLHWPNRHNYHFNRHFIYNPVDTTRKQVEEEMLEILQTLGDLQKQGKIRHAGLSNESAWGTMMYLQLAEKHGLPRMASIQNEYSLLTRLFDFDLQEVALREDVGLLAWSPLARGLLTGKYRNGVIPEGSRMSIARTDHRDTPEAHGAVEEYVKLAEKHGLDPAQMALAFVHERPFLTSNIIGATSMEQLKVNIDSLDVTLSDEVAGEIQAIYRKYPIPY